MKRIGPSDEEVLYRRIDAVADGIMCLRLQLAALETELTRKINELFKATGMSAIMRTEARGQRARSSGRSTSRAASRMATAASRR
jgi:hypothetical protein